MPLIAAILLVHGVAHLVGFVRAWGLSTATAPRPPLVDLGAAGVKVTGILWLLLALTYVVAAVLVLMRAPLAIWVTLGTSVVSLVLCTLTWPDARLGIPIDALLIAGALLAFRATPSYVETRFSKEFVGAELGLPESAIPISEHDIAALPEPVKRYFRFMGVVGKPRDRSIRARFDARFRRAEGPWLDCQAFQYDTRLDVSRIFYMRLSLARVLPVLVRDTYRQGKGRMLARAFDLVTVVDGTGMELDTGELVTYLNDAILMAPSLILGPETTWSAVDEKSFDVAFTDFGRTVHARVFLDDRGAPTNFVTTDRYFDMPDGKRVKTEWNTPIEGWQTAAGRSLPTRAKAVWMLPSGPFVYADFAFDAARIVFNERRIAVPKGVGA
jgi:hypothetical protein